MRLLVPTATALILLCSASLALSEDAKPESLDGVWIPATAVMGGKPFPDELRKSIKLEIKGEDYTVTVGDQPDKGTCKLNPKATPKEIDIVGGEGPNKGKTILAIYERKGDTLKVCYELGGKGRPTEFQSPEGSRRFLVEYKREK